MISKHGFDDISLSQSLYQTLLERFCDSFDSVTQQLLEDCSFGFAPSPLGLSKTFFIVAGGLEVAEKLIERVDTIIAHVNDLMAGVDQTAICFNPPQSQLDSSLLFDSTTSQKRISGEAGVTKFMVGRIFPHPQTQENE